MTYKKIKFVCRTCGSDDVFSDAYAEWDVDNQRWEINNVFDKGAYCNKCDEETRLEEVEINEVKNDNTQKRNS